LAVRFIDFYGDSGGLGVHIAKVVPFSIDNRWAGRLVSCLDVIRIC